MIIGLTGLPCSGSDAVGHILAAMGFEWLSYSDILREELKMRGMEITRKNMQTLGNEIRNQYGAGELSKRLLLKTQPGKNYVFGTIRNPGEIKVLRARDDFMLVGVEASQTIRFNRMMARARESDPITWEQFLLLDMQERGHREGTGGLRISDCMALADYTLKNEGTIEELRYKIEQMLNELKH